jgi:hypothetical protein
MSPAKNITNGMTGVDSGNRHHDFSQEQLLWVNRGLGEDTENIAIMDGIRSKQRDCEN